MIALPGVLSIDVSVIGGSVASKLGCAEWSKMGSYAFENCKVWTAGGCSDVELLSKGSKLDGW